MDNLLAILPIILPVAFWSAYHLHKDRHLPEPTANLVLCFGLGLLSFYLGKSMYLGLDLIGWRLDAFSLAETSRIGLFLYSIAVIGVIEELAKFIPFLLVVLRFRAFDEPVDGIIYASFIALGFATLENVHYLDFLTGLEALGRGFAGPLVHIMFASIWAYHLGRAHLYRRSRLIAGIGFLALTALLHGAYDFLVIAMPLTALPVAALMILSIWLWRMHLIRDLNRAAGTFPADGTDY
jgi:RsiW-degrading membrane proteinase PrsW (M82 family)